MLTKTQRMCMTPRTQFEMGYIDKKTFQRREQNQINRSIHPFGRSDEYRKEQRRRRHA